MSDTLRHPISCPLCDGPMRLLGALGRLLHFRCRNCDWEGCHEAEEEEDYD